LLARRYPEFHTLGDWFGPALVLWSIPFIWIGVGMSIRRAADAGLSSWVGLLFFVPGLNYALMLTLSVLPSSGKAVWNSKAVISENHKYGTALALTCVFAAAGVLLSWFSTNFLKTYATSLFVGSPLILGLVQGYFLNVRAALPAKKAAGFVVLTILFIHLFLLLFALEGLICIAMSLPLSAAMGVIGAVLGVAIAEHGKPSSLAPMLLVLGLPVAPWVEKSTTAAHRDMVLSTIEIDAARADVWPHVVSFSDLPPATEWLFKLGVAHPVRARIEGHGPGAVRHCEFSTGAFVEPITIWEEPSHLAFDVQYQPAPMKELSFYDHVEAPHLHGYFRSVKGEFRLIATAAGKTLLEGRTWYEMDIQPGWYWQIYGRWFIHQIHGRVLAHIKNLSELAP